MRKSWSVVGLAFILGLALLAGACGVKSVATVNGKKITQKEFDRRFEQLKAYALQSGATFEGESGQYMLAGLEREALDALEQEIIVQDAAAKQKITVTDEEVDKYINEHKAQSFKTEEEFKAFLEKNKMTEAELKNAVKNQMLSQKLYEAVTKNVTVTNAEIEQYYKQNQAQFKPRIKVSHILIKAEELSATQDELAKAKKKAEDIIKQLNNGADFKKLAKQYSDDPGSKDAGGFFDYAFSQDDPNIDPSFRDAAFTLKKIGEITQEPVKSQFGYHIIKLEEKLDDLQSQQAEIQKQALLLKKNSVYQDYMNKLKKEAKIKEDFTSKYATKEWTKNNTQQNKQNTKKQK